MKKIITCLLTCILCLSLVKPVNAASIKINATSTTIKVGKTKKLKVLNTSRKVTWSSTNKKIAKVSSKGKVTAVKPGSCTIKAKVKGKAKVYKCKVTVKAWLSVTSASLLTGSSKTLTLKGTKIKSCTTSKTNVISVAQSSTTKAKVTALSCGSSTVTIKGTNGKTYKCTTSVSDPTPNYTPKEFIEAIAPIVQKYSAQYGYGVPSAIIAQACLESGYGSSKKAKLHNYFGLKYRAKRLTCHSGIFTDTNKEQKSDGSYVTISTDWYQFASMDAGVEGYFQFIAISNYAKARKAKDPEAYLTALKEGGYASSLSYVKSNMAVVNKWDLTQYDQ